MRPIGSKDKVKRTRLWQPWQDDYLRTHYKEYTDRELSDGLEKSVRQLRKRARELGLDPKIKYPSRRVGY